MMLGFLLARAGVDVVVLEKYPDFFRDFRGDTIHPSTLELMHELGLLDAFLALPHQEYAELSGKIGDRSVVLADFRHVPTHAKYLALMPQWDFLNFLAEQGRRYRGFHVEMQAEAVELVRDGERVRGVRAQTPKGMLEIEADLVVGADGRHSTVRERAGFAVRDLGAAVDVLWVRIPKPPAAEGQTFGTIAAGRILVLLDRADYYQAAYVIDKGAFAQVRARGLDAFRADIVRLAPYVRDTVDAITSWDDVKLLTVRIDRLERWYAPGLLCIGDAAHAMSPVGGVGINLAIQDAVAAANILALPLRDGRVTVEMLAAVQRRRAFAARATQAVQVFIQNRVMLPVLGSTKEITFPAPLRVFDVFPVLRRIPAYLVGVGVRPEHIRTPSSG